MKNITFNGSYFESKYNIHVASYYKKNRRSYERKVLYPLKNLFFKFLVHCIIKKNNVQKKYKIVLCAIFKNEGRFLKEWIEYHYLIGVEHFYMYNNNSTDNYRDVLEPYIMKGIVTLKDWPQIPGQIPAYKNWYENYRKDCEWCSFLDLDEFICPKYDYDLHSWLEKYKKYPVIRIDWLMFGTSNLEQHNDDQLVIEQYTHCWNKPVNIGKVLYNCCFDIAHFNNTMHHALEVKWHSITIPPFNDTGNVCIDYCHEVHAHEESSIQINHYYSRAFNILNEKLTKGDSAYVVNKKKDAAPYINREMNCVRTDYTIQRYLLRLKLLIRVSSSLFLKTNWKHP